MVTSTGEKEKQVLKFIETQSKKEKWNLLTNEEIINALSDKEFDSNDMEDMLKDLENKNRIIPEEMRFKVYLSKVSAKSIQNKFKRHLASTQNISYFISFLILSWALTNERFFNIFLNFVIQIGTSSSNYSLLVGGFIATFTSIIIINFFVSKSLEKLQDELPKIKEFMWVIYTLSIFVLIGVFLHKFLSISNEVSATIAVIGGVSMLGIIHLIRKDKKD